MNMKATKKMRGFMCQSPAAIAVCTSDPLSVIVPQRPNQMLVEHTRLINNAKYSQLIESRRFAPVTRRSATVPSLTSEQDHVEGQKKASPSSFFRPCLSGGGNESLPSLPRLCW